MLEKLPRLATPKHVDGAGRYAQLPSPIGSGLAPSVGLLVPVVQDSSGLLLCQLGMRGVPPRGATRSIRTTDPLSGSGHRPSVPCVPGNSGVPDPPRTADTSARSPRTGSPPRRDPSTFSRGARRAWPCVYSPTLGETVGQVLVAHSPGRRRKFRINRAVCNHPKSKHPGVPQKPFCHLACQAPAQPKRRLTPRSRTSSDGRIAGGTSRPWAPRRPGNTAALRSSGNTRRGTPPQDRRKRAAPPS